MNGPAIAIVSALAMEPLSAAVHRYFGHGPGWRLHRDHHEPTRRFQRNDLIPFAFAGITMAAFAVGSSGERFRWLFWIATGVTTFGLSYALVHDVYIHRRVPLLPRRVAILEPWRRAHAQHHASGGPPFGVLVPVGPRRRRTRRTTQASRTHS